MGVEEKLPPGILLTSVEREITDLENARLGLGPLHLAQPAEDEL